MIEGEHLRPAAHQERAKYDYILQAHPPMKATVRLVSSLAAGAEYYAAFGPVTHFLSVPNQLHRLMGVIDYVRTLSKSVDLDLNIGAGYNLSGTGDRWLVKAIVGESISKNRGRASSSALSRK